MVFCLAACVVQVAANDCWNTTRKMIKMMSQFAFYSEVCAILAKEADDSFINLVVRSSNRDNCGR